MATDTPGVGDPVQSRCTKCRRLTRHLVVSLVEAKPVRVQCTACEGIHNFRPPKAPASPRRAAAARRKPVSAAARSEAAAQEFEEAMGDRDRTRTVPYRMTNTFRSKDLLKHPTFGLGLVRQVVPPNKIRVLFRDGLRTLRCAG